MKDLNPTLALSVKQLSKVYANGKNALKGISFEVGKGDFFGLLGPNGAGKSTTIGILTSLIKKSAGEVSICGIDIDVDFSAAKRHLGVVPQEMNFDIFDTVANIVLNYAGYHGIASRQARARTEQVLREVELWEQRHQVARTLSGGMKRRLMIARSLVHQPDILILDEPTAGVDLEIRRHLWQYLKHINQQGISIILTTHYLEEAEYLCRQIAILEGGKIIENQPTSVLLAQLNSEQLILNLAEPLEHLPFEGYKTQLIDPWTLEIELKNGDTLNTLFQQLTQHQVSVRSLRNKTNRLEEIFLKLTQSSKKG